MDYQALSNAIGVIAKTIKQRLSVLEASYLVVNFPSYVQNFGKRVVKSPKYFFTDAGPLAYLLVLETPSGVLRDTLLGRIFQNLLVIEVLKQRCNNGYDANLYFFRDSNGSKIDLLCKTSNRLVGIETKAVFTRYGKFAKQKVGFAVKTNRLIKVWLSTKAYNFSPVMALMPFLAID